MLFNRIVVKNYYNETYYMDDKYLNIYTNPTSKNIVINKRKTDKINNNNDEIFCKLCMLLLETNNKCVFLTTNNGRLYSTRPQFCPFSFFFIFFTLFTPIYTFTAFESPLVLFSWWRNKIS